VVEHCLGIHENEPNRQRSRVQKREKIHFPRKFPPEAPLFLFTSFDKTKKIIIIKNLLQINKCLLTLAGVA